MGPFFVGEIVWMSLQRPAFCLKVAAYGMLMGHKPSSRPLLMKSIGPLVNRRRFAASVLMGGLSLPLAAEVQSEIASESFTQGSSPPNPLLWAVAWANTSAEFGALCHQAYNLATLRVELALEKHSSERPLAVITDIDHTVVHSASYWAYLVDQGVDFFDDALWDEWIPRNLMTPVPGAMEFLAFCEEQGVEVFYVTNRDQGEETYDYALKQLQYLDLPFADADHLTVYRETSDKSPSREAIGKTHEVVALLGDNLNDYKRDYYVKDIDERYALMERDREDFGETFILFPNPTDGHWVRAIFGESEPAATDENRQLLMSAASRNAWDGF